MWISMEIISFKNSHSHPTSPINDKFTGDFERKSSYLSAPSFATYDHSSISQHYGQPGKESCSVLARSFAKPPAVPQQSSTLNRSKKFQMTARMVVNMRLKECFHLFCQAMNRKSR